MRTYASLLRVEDFPALVVASTVSVAAGVLSGLALAVSVFARTGSALLSAVALFGPSFGHLVGASFLLAWADRLPPRAALVLLTAGQGGVLLVLAVPGLPVPLVLAVVVASGVLASLGAGVRWGLVSQVLPPEGYVLGRSVVQTATGAVQVGGNALGAALLVVVTPSAALCVAAGLDLVAALVLRTGLRRRRPRRADRAGWTRTWEGNRRLWARPGVPAVYLALWVPNGLVVGAEALFVPYAGSAAGLLFAAGAAGMLAGDALVGRLVPPHWRARLVTPVRVLLAAPYLLFLTAPGTGVAAAVVAVASLGFSAGLLLQERLLALTPSGERGQALGLHSSGMLALQGVGALLAGGLAEHVPAGTAMALVAGASLLATLVLTPALARVPALSPRRAGPPPPRLLRARPAFRRRGRPPG